MSRIVVVGAGPGGIAAACRAADSGATVTLIDDNPSPGGQIWRGGKPVSGDSASGVWLSRFSQARIDRRLASQVVNGNLELRELTIETADGRYQYQLPFDKLILATGARELFLPFPGWTLPHVTGAGGLQALVKSGLSVRGKRVVVAGSGPLLLAVAAYLKSQGAIIPLVVEQAPLAKLAACLPHLLSSLGKLRQALRLQLGLLGVPYRPDSWIESAEGDSRLRQVHVHGGARPLACDYLAIGYGLIPNTELAQMLGCRLAESGVAVDENQRTSVDGVFCAGETAGIGGLDTALAGGEIAGYAAAGDTSAALRLHDRRRGARSFARALEASFALRPELKTLATPETIVCRCEDVPYRKLHDYSEWREAKLQTRCGMGPCQGRICGAATEVLFGWKHTSVRPPVLPARVGSLIRQPAGEERS